MPNFGTGIGSAIASMQSQEHPERPRDTCLTIRLLDVFRKIPSFLRWLSHTDPQAYGCARRSVVVARRAAPWAKNLLLSADDLQGRQGLATSAWSASSFRQSR